MWDLMFVRGNPLHYFHFPTYADAIKFLANFSVGAQFSPGSGGDRTSFMALRNLPNLSSFKPCVMLGLGSSPVDGGRAWAGPMMIAAPITASHPIARPASRHTLRLHAVPDAHP